LAPWPKKLRGEWRDSEERMVDMMKRAARLRRDQPVPLYYQLEMDLRRAIEAGEFHDQQFPTEREMVSQYGVSRMTVRQALSRLEEDGLIERQRARGTFVRPEARAKIERLPGAVFDFAADLRRQGAESQFHVLGVEWIEPPVAVARGLSLAAGEHTYRARRIGYVHGEPILLETHYFPPDVGAALAARDLSSGPLNMAVEQALGVQLITMHLRVEADAASRQQARQLCVRLRHPLLVNQYTFLDQQGRALHLLRVALRGDKYALAFSLPLPVHRPPDRGLLWSEVQGENGHAWPQLTRQQDVSPTGI
jgi:GntR family transcriptional regulator